LYALNGLFPLALAWQAGLVGAAVIGGAAMAVFLASTLLPARTSRADVVAVPFP